MANIVVTATPVDLNVSTTLSNITVTDVETNVTVNVASSTSDIAVTTSLVNVSIAPSIGVSNNEIRAALSATLPITFDNSTGDFGFDADNTDISVQSLTSTNYINASGNIATTANLSVTNDATIGGDLTASTLALDDATLSGGNYTQSGANITFAQGNIVNGSLQLDNDITIGGEFNGTLNDFDLTYYDAGNVSGNVTLDLSNGNVQKIRLTNNLTGLTFTGIASSTPITLIVQQDNVGFWTIDTSTYSSNWTAWKWVNNFKTLSTSANAYDLISITYDGTNYYSSVVNFFQSLITNGELANSNITINGTTIALGSSGNITTSNIAEGSNLYFTAARARGNISAALPITYNGATGQIGWTNGEASINALRINGNTPRDWTSISLDVYSFAPADAARFNGNISVTERVTAVGNITSSSGYFIGNGSLLTGIPTLTNAQVISYISTVPLTVGGNLTVNGNINATGNINVQNVEDLYVRDQTIVMNANAASPANVQIVSNRPGFANTAIKWNEQTDRWTFTNDGTTYYNIATSTTDLAEGTNLYYTTDRANTAIGAYQGSINTSGNVTASVVNATTVNTTNLTATNNVYALGALHSPDGSNIQYVRAWNVDYETTNTTSSLNVLLESENNSRIAYASGGNLRYIPATKTLFITDGIIGSNDTNLTGNVLTVNTASATGNITASGNVQGAYVKGNGSQLTGITTTQVTEGTNLYYTTARANSAIAAYQGTINTAGNITTSANVQADSVILDKLHYEVTGTPSYASSVPVDTYGWYDNLGNGRAWFSIAVSGQSGVFTHGERISFSGVTGNGAANLNSQTFYVDAANAYYGNTSYMFCTDAALTTYVTMSGFGIVDGGTLGGNALYDYSAGTGVVWEVKLDASNNLAIEKDGVSQTTISTTGLANVNSISTKTGSNLTLATDKEVGITTVQRNNDIVSSANIHGEGFAVSQTSSFFDAPFFSYSGAGQLKTYVFDASITAGSNVITVTNIYDLQGVSANVSDVAPYYVYTDFPLQTQASSFPPGTYVTGVSGSNIYMSANATITDTFAYDGGDPYASYGGLTAGARDNTTGLLIALESNYDDGGANAQLITYNFMTDTKNYYAYGINGPVTTNFTYSRGTASDYAINTNVLSKSMFARTDFSANRTVGNFRRGLTVGDADLTNRAENDGLQTFGLNVLWDGTANVEQEYGSSVGIFPQILMKQYTDGTAQGVLGNTSTSWAAGGPRLMFVGAYGKSTNDPLSTYARANQELGSIKWLTTTAGSLEPSTIGPPAYISAVSLKDQTSGPGDVGLYLVASPTAGTTSTSQVGGSAARALFVGHHKANTIISAASRTNGTSGDIMFTPARAASNRGNAAQMAEQVSTSVAGAAQWARIGYDNPSANTGARVEVTNGFNTASARNGNVTLKINRNDNGVGFGSKAWALKLRSGQTDLVLTEDDVIRATFAGGNITATTFVGNLSGTTATLTGNVNATNYNGNTVILTAPSGSPSYASSVPVDQYGWYDNLGNGRAWFSIAVSGQSGVFTHGERISFTGVTGAGSANLNNQTFYVDAANAYYGNTSYMFCTDAALTTYVTMSGFGIVDGNTQGGNALYDYTSGAVGSTWTIDPNGANLDITNGTATTVIDTNGNITLATNATINYDAVYGCFHNMSNVTAAAADTVYEFAWPNVHINTNRVTVASNSRITIGQEGAYNFALEMQAENSNNQDRTAYLWLAKNGTDIAETCVRVTLLKEWKQVIVKEWIVNGINANDYIEVRFAVDNTSGIQLTSIPAQASPYARPAVPSAVITITPVGA